MKIITGNPHLLTWFRNGTLCSLPGSLQVLTILLLFWLSLPLMGQQTYIVTKTVDTNGSCDTGDCSLREAIMAANADGVASLIRFNFATGSAPFTILVRGTPLPPLVDEDTEINALAGNTYGLGDVIVDGRLLAGTPNGFLIVGDNAEIYGLQIQNFGGDGIEAGATGAGIISAVIADNIIVDNGGSGIFCPIQLDLTVNACFIGTNENYGGGLGNAGHGISYNSLANGTPPVFRVTNSAIANNGAGGIRIDGRTSFTIAGNNIGTNPAATVNLDTGSSGIDVQNNNFGGTISNNNIGFSGRGINSPAGNPITITENRIFCNTASGIVRGSNTLQVTITAAGPATLSGTSNVAGGRVEVFLEDLAGCSPSTPCQGKTFLGSTAVTGGNWSLDVTGLVSLGDVVTATVTQGLTFGVPNTSPFAACQTVSCPAITASIDETPSCAGAGSGALTANPVGGTGPYTFNWSNGATGATITGLNPGSYNVTVLDAEGCRALATGQVDEIPSPAADAGPDQLICAGSSTTLTASVLGGAPPYDFIWQPGGGEASITVSPTETTVYDLTVTDSQGCQDVDQLIVRIRRGTQQPDAGPDQALCRGEAANLQGSIGADPGAAGLWTASVGGGSFSPDATALDAVYTPPPGITSVTLTLSTTNGTTECPDLSDEMIITYAQGPTVDAGPDQTACTNSPVTLEGIIGGTGAPGGWSASVSGGNFSPDSLALDAVYTPPPGVTGVILTLLAEDASGLGLCPAVRDQMTITYTDSGATVEAGPAQVICAGESVVLNGSFGGSATGIQWRSDGDGTFADPNDPGTTYTPGPNDVNAQGAVLTLTSLSTGSCPPASDNVSVRIIALPAYTVAGRNPSTCGDPDGNFTVSGLDPGAGYELSYLFEGAIVQLAQDASAAGEITVDNLGDGIYSEIILTDDNGCSGPARAVTLSSPDGPSLSADPASICLGTAGEITANSAGGTPPYNHQWIDQGTGTATGYILSNTNVASLSVDAGGAQPGTINLEYRVLDSNGCLAVLPVTVNLVAGPSITAIQIDSASAPSAANGRLQFRIDGGLGPHIYSWTGPVSGSGTAPGSGAFTIGNLSGGNYSLFLSDVNGCSTTFGFRIGVNTTGGGVCTTDAGSLQEVTGGSVQACSSSSVSLIHNGDQVLDADDALVFVLKELSGQIIKTNTEPVFDFDPGIMTLDTEYRASARAGNATGGTAGVDPADPCLDESNAVSIVFRASLNGVLNFIQGEEELCQGEELILSTNNLGTVAYFWITPARDTLVTGEPLVIIPNVQPEDAGEYYVIARDGDCLDDQTGPFSLIVNGLPAGTLICAGDNQTVCEATVNLQACDPGPGSGFWTSPSGARISSPGSPATSATDLSPGENLFVWAVNISECGPVGTDTVRVVYERALFAQPDAFTLERANTEIFMDVLKNDNIAEGVDLELTALTQPAFGVLETLPNGFRYYEYEQRRGTIEFIYQVCYLGGTCIGTCDTATVMIEVLNLPYLPEGITPDGDGRNDELTVLGYTPGNAELRLQLTIANQWGEIIYQSNDYTNSDPWKGTYKGQPVPQGAYYCHLETIVPEGSFVRTQTVYVVR